MIRALIWKEIREHRWTFLGFLAVLLSLKPALGWMAADAIRRGSTNYFSITMMLLAGLLPIYAIVLGAHTFAHEQGKGTLAFLLTRPIGRLPIMGVKVTVSLAFLALGLLASTLVLNERFSFGWDGMTVIMVGGAAPTATAVLVLFWACALAASTFSRNLLTAVIVGSAGMAATMTTLAAADLTQQAFLPVLVLAAGAAVALAQSIFDLPPDAAFGSRVARGIRTSAVAGLVIYLSLHGLVPLLRPSMSRGRVSGLRSTVHGVAMDLNLPASSQFYRPIRAVALRDHEGRTRAWKNHLGSHQSTWSPDGRFVALASQANHWGLQGSKDRLRVCKADGTLLYERHWGRSFQQACWSRDGSVLACALAAPTAWLFPGPRRSLLELYYPETGRSLIIDSPRLEELDPWDWRPVAFRREGKSILLLIDRDEERGKAAHLEEIGLDGSVLAVHGPFADGRSPSFVRPLAAGSLLFRWRENEEDTVFARWTADRPSELTAVVRFGKDWGPLAFSDDLKEALVWRNKRVEADAEKKFQGLNWNLRTRSTMALLSLTASSTTAVVPLEGEIFSSRELEFRGSHPWEFSLPSACWSPRDGAFAYSNDGKAVRLIRPGQSTSTPFVDLQQVE